MKINKIIIGISLLTQSIQLYSAAAAVSGSFDFLQRVQDHMHFLSEVLSQSPLIVAKAREIVHEINQSLSEELRFHNPQEATAKIMILLSNDSHYLPNQEKTKKDNLAGESFTKKNFLRLFIEEYCSKKRLSRDIVLNFKTLDDCLNAVFMYFFISDTSESPLQTHVLFGKVEKFLVKKQSLCTLQQFNQWLKYNFPHRFKNKAILSPAFSAIKTHDKLMKFCTVLKSGQELPLPFPLLPVVSVAASIVPVLPTVSAEPVLPMHSHQSAAASVAFIRPAAASLPQPQAAPVLPMQSVMPDMSQWQRMLDARQAAETDRLARQVEKESSVNIQEIEDFKRSLFDDLGIKGFGDIQGATSASERLLSSRGQKRKAGSQNPEDSQGPNALLRSGAGQLEAFFYEIGAGQTPSVEDNRDFLALLDQPLP